MLTKGVKVGDVVAWSLCGPVPWGALLRHRPGWIALRSEGRFRWVQMAGEWRYEPRQWGSGGALEEGARWDLFEGEFTIIALGLTGQETAADLQRMAEVFEVREALKVVQSLYGGANWFVMLGDHVWPWGFGSNKHRALDVMSKRLHAVGWLPGMTAEDAARLLAEVRPC